MKRMISFLTVLTLAGAMTASMTAFADDYEINTTPGNYDTTVTFDVNPSYTITIPQTVTLTGNYGDNFTGSGTITASDVFLSKTEKIVVTLSSESLFNLTTTAAADYKLPYTATGNFGDITGVGSGKVAEFTTPEEVKQTESVTVSFATNKTPLYAGKYTDPVVFNIKVEDTAATAD